MALTLNTQTIDALAKRILDADVDVRISVLAKATVIVDAIDQLGESYEQDLAERISMTPTTLSRWKAIGRNQIIQQNQPKMPSAMGSLYAITVLENALDKNHGKGSGLKRIQKMLDDGVLSSSTQRNFIEGKIKEQNELSAKRKARENEKKIEALQSKKVVQQPSKLQDFIDRAELFRTIVIVPSSEQIATWKKLDFPVEIGDDYPIHEIRKTTQTGSVLCLLVIQRKQIDLGIDCLKGWGFSYRDLVSSAKSNEVILLGVRGTFSQEHQHPDEVSLDTAMLFAENIGKTPRMVIGAKTDRKNWTVCDG